MGTDLTPSEKGTRRSLFEKLRDYFEEEEEKEKEKARPIQRIQTDIRPRPSLRADEERERREANIIREIGWENSKSTNYDGHCKRTRVIHPDGSIHEEEEIITHLDTESYEPPPPPPTLIVQQPPPPFQPPPKEVTPVVQEETKPGKPMPTELMIAIGVLAALVLVILMAVIVNASRREPTYMPPPQYAPQPERTVYRDRVTYVPVEKIVYRDRIVEKPVERVVVREAPPRIVRVGHRPPDGIEHPNGDPRMMRDSLGRIWYSHSHAGLVHWDTAQRVWIDFEGGRHADKTLSPSPRLATNW